jgi:hypothetical protein
MNAQRRQESASGSSSPSDLTAQPDVKASYVQPPRGQRHEMAEHARVLSGHRPVEGVPGCSGAAIVHTLTYLTPTSSQSSSHAAEPDRTGEYSYVF